MRQPTYRELIRRGAAQHGPRTALVCDGRSLTFEEADALGARLARALLARGVMPRSPVGLLVSNSLYSVPCDFACTKANVNRVPLNTRLAAAEQVRMLALAGARTLLYSPDQRERALELAQRTDALEPIALFDGAGASPSLLDDAARQSGSDPEVDARPDDVVLTLFSSGTSGAVKAIQHTHETYCDVSRNILLNLIDVSREDVMLHAASLVHATGTFVLPFWVRGATTVIAPGFSAPDYLELVVRHGVTVINVVPTMLKQLLEQDLERYDLSRLARIIYGASPTPRPLLEQAIERLGRRRFWQYYGQTENTLCLTVLRPEDHLPGRLGSCGQPSLDVELRIVRADGTPCGTGEAGEILVRGGARVGGFVGDAQMRSQTFAEDGWVRTRDVGMIDAEGFVHLLDRSSDMIVTGGFNVYPREVEDALAAHPAVAECAVVGLPDAHWVERVAAAVVLRPGHRAEADALIGHVAGRIASYKKPRSIRFVESLPRTAVGKVARRLVRDLLLTED